MLYLEGVGISEQQHQEFGNYKPLELTSLGQVQTVWDPRVSHLWSQFRAKAGDPGPEGLSQTSTSSLPGSHSFAFYFSSTENPSPNPTPGRFV